LNLLKGVIWVMNVKKISIIIMSCLLIFSSIPMTVSAAEIRPYGMIVEHVTNRIYTKYKWELAEKDYSSELKEYTTTVSTTITARTGNEAIAKAEASISAGSELIGANASLKGEVGTTSSGETTYEWKVTGTKVTKRIQYYDLYKKYAYNYYIVEFKDSTSGVVVQIINKGEFKNKVYTGTSGLKEGRFTTP